MKSILLKSWLLLAMAAVLMVGVGCEREENIAPASFPQKTSEVPSRVPSSQPDSMSNQTRIVFLGDSITAGWGLSPDEAFPALVGDALQQEKIAATVVNAGVSGDTTAGGLRRLDWLLRQKPDVIVVGLGGNDGLRGLDPRESEQNLRQIIQRSRQAGATVLLLGMMIPPNYGPEYTAQFRDIYPRVARDLDVPLMPFLLEGVGGIRNLNQPDGIHPTAEGHRIIAEKVLPHLRPLLEKEAHDGGPGARSE